MRRLKDLPAIALLAGADYRNTPALEREALVKVAAGFHQWVDARRSESIAEGFALSTCHRVEFYVATSDVAAATKELRTFARSLTGTDALGPAEVLTRAKGAMAIGHLCRVTSGLESMVLGEHEISGQVRRTALDARAAGAVGPILNAAVAAALTCSGRIRTETSLGHGSASLAGVAVQSLAREVDLTRSRVLVIGAGSVSREAARRLVRHRPLTLTIASRSHEHARALAAEVAGASLGLHSLPEALGDHDACLAAITASSPVVGITDLAGLRDFQHRPLAIADLSLPRVFDSRVASVPGVRLITIDDLGTAAETVRARRLAAVPTAEAIVHDETRRAMARLDAMAARLVHEAVA
jgi:glutamyl-tRNA reductase